MATRRNPYADPALAQSFNNIASMFAPPSGADLAGYANASAKKAEAQRLADLFAYSKDPNYDRGAFERQAIAAGLYNPSNSFYSVDQSNMTTRRGQDVTALTSRENNIRDNSRAMAQTRYGALSEGQVLPAMPSEVASMYGLVPAPEQRGIVKLNQNQTASLPDGQTMTGINRPLSMDEMMAQQFAEQRKAGLIDDQTTRDLIVGKQAGTPVTGLGPDGKPQFMTPGAAVRMGAQPVQDPTKRTNATAILPDGRTQVPAMQGPDGAWYHAQTNERLPPDVRVVEMAKPQGANEQLGITTANQSDANKRAAEVTRTLNLLDMYEKLVDNNPGALGLVGLIRGTAQNAAATVNDVSRAFGKDIPQINDAATEIRAGLSKVAPQLFDPSIPEAAFLQGALAYGLARTENPSGEVSRQAYERALERVQGGGMLANTQSTKAQINSFRNVLQGELSAIGALRNPATARTSTGAGPIGGPGGTTPAAPQQPGGVERFVRDPQTGRLVRAQ